MMMMMMMLLVHNDEVPMIYNRIRENVSVVYASPRYPPATPGGADVAGSAIISSNYWNFTALTEMRLVICRGLTRSLSP